MTLHTGQGLLHALVTHSADTPEADLLQRAANLQALCTLVAASSLGAASASGECGRAMSEGGPTIDLADTGILIRAVKPHSRAREAVPGDFEFLELVWTCPLCVTVLGSNIVETIWFCQANLWCRLLNLMWCVHRHLYPSSRPWWTVLS